MRNKQKRRVRVDYDEVELGDNIVELHKEVSIEVAGGRHVKASVTRVEAADEGITIYAQPSVQFAGSHFEFQMNLAEYHEAVIQAENEVLDCMIESGLSD